MAKNEWEVTITKEDVRFIKLAMEHYKVFSEVSQKQGDERTAGIFQSQLFYAERFLLRIEAVRAILAPGGEDG